MRLVSEYHSRMRRRFPLPIVSLALLAFTVLLTTSHAQTNGVPSSVTSPSFGGRAVNGAAASVTSLGPRGYAPNPQVRFSTSAASRSPHSGNGQHTHRRRGESASPLFYAYPYPVPYAVDDGAGEDVDPPESDSNYQGGPTVFDRRGSGARSYIPPIDDASNSRSAEPTDDATSDPEPADPTLLVFKDGRKMEVGNYAIVGATLFDLTPGHPRKIALAELDLEATRKQNDDRGIIFQLPPSLRVN